MGSNVIILYFKLKILVSFSFGVRFGNGQIASNAFKQKKHILFVMALSDFGSVLTLACCLPKLAPFAFQSVNILKFSLTMMNDLAILRDGQSHLSKG
jgi:hypothetical protein